MNIYQTKKEKKKQYSVSNAHVFLREKWWKIWNHPSLSTNTPPPLPPYFWTIFSWLTFVQILKTRPPLPHLILEGETRKTLVRTAKSAEAVIRRCSVNKVFWKIVKNAQEKTCPGVSFWWSFRSWGLQPYQKSTPAKVFSCEFWSFREHIFCRICANSPAFLIQKILHPEKTAKFSRK